MRNDLFYWTLLGMFTALLVVVIAAICTCCCCYCCRRSKKKPAKDVESGKEQEEVEKPPQQLQREKQQQKQQPQRGRQQQQQQQQPEVRQDRVEVVERDKPSSRDHFIATKDRISPHPEQCPINYRIVRERWQLRSKSANARHVYSGRGELSLEAARQMSQFRSSNPTILKNTVVKEPDYWNLCQKTTDISSPWSDISYSPRVIVSSHRVTTVHCTRMFGNSLRWTAEHRGKCFAVFTENGHFDATETYKTAIC